MAIIDALSDWLGLRVEAKDLTVLQVSVRGIIVFVVALVILRIADRRFLAKLSAFDALLGLILASMLARAINGSAPFVPTLVGGFVIVLLHRLLAWLAFKSPLLARLVKGNDILLVRNGKQIQQSMRANRITEDDLMEEVRLIGQVQHVGDIQTATLERNGEISVIPEK